MKNKENKHLDKLVEDVMKQAVLESPSFNFTTNVMQQITADSKSTSTVYKPLISKTGWKILVLSVLTLIGYVFVSGNSQNSEWFEAIDFSAWTKYNLPNLFSGIKVSHSTWYALVLFGVMICVQIPLLKSYFNKRLNL
ncbi:hypothetical protein [Xanthomarina sp.]|uniref:hypothetical protein n=1 Tax=Xanthomarina sp. TaxID=1931211 RepID=UPI002B55AC9B|nr:hypothetical protein [Xanthomarina sp.]HLV40415.1 hypothetical protein [Xanthomarina sp.]